MGSSGGYCGWAYKVTPEGAFVPYASGLRSPAGIGVSPAGEVFYSDSQGDWVGTSKLHLLVSGAFYGHPASLIDDPEYTRESVEQMTVEELDAMRTKPVLWIPRNEVANSPGNPEWDVTEGKFGPFAGQIFIGDQTQSNVFRATLQKVKGQYHGMAINFMNGFASGNIRLKFGPNGELWVGQTARGRHARGTEAFGLQKATWDGTNPFEVLDVKLTKRSFRIEFAAKLDSATVNLDALKVEHWWYEYHSKYGSPKAHLAEARLDRVRLLRDGKTIDVRLPLAAERVYGIDCAGFIAPS